MNITIKGLFLQGGFHNRQGVVLHSVEWRGIAQIASDHEDGRATNTFRYRGNVTRLGEATEFWWKEARFQR